VWNTDADPRETLCASCLFERMVRQLGRMPCFADLRPRYFNTLHSPYSWFDLFISKEKQPPALDDEWRGARGDGWARRRAGVAVQGLPLPDRKRKVLGTFSENRRVARQRCAGLGVKIFL
jgi:hypothetical protein